MKKLIYPLLTLSILFTIGCDDDKKEESVDSIIGTWTLSAVCGFEDENCSGTCTDVTAMWLEDEGSFSMTSSSDGTGTLGDHDAGEVCWSGTKTALLSRVLRTHHHGPPVRLNVLELKHGLVVDD